MRGVTADRLRFLLDYDADSGIFTWRGRTSNRVKIGSIAGSRHGAGYVQINVDGSNFLAHRLAWLHAHGTWPKGTVDHINGDRTDNRLLNLRDVSQGVNNGNVRKLPRHNTSGLLGASWCAADERWAAHISVDGKSRFLGNFDTADDAHAAYLTAKRRLHAGCTI